MRCELGFHNFSWSAPYLWMQALWMLSLSQHGLNKFAILLFFSSSHFQMYFLCEFFFLLLFIKMEFRSCAANSALKSVVFAHRCSLRSSSFVSFWNFVHFSLFKLLENQSSLERLRCAWMRQTKLATILSTLLHSIKLWNVEVLRI